MLLLWADLPLDSEDGEAGMGMTGDEGGCRSRSGATRACTELSNRRDRFGVRGRSHQDTVSSCAKPPPAQGSQGHDGHKGAPGAREPPEVWWLRVEVGIGSWFGSLILKEIQFL